MTGRVDHPPEPDGTGDSPVEVYLDALLVELSAGPPRHARQFLAETEAHLRDAVADGMATGLTAATAEYQAVARFGRPEVLAGDERRRQPTPISAVVRACVSSGLLLGGIGGLAVGMSGLITAGLGLIGGSRFIIDGRAGQVLPAPDCARWLAGDPRARSCAQAAVADWAFDTIASRVAVGLLGVMALVAFVLVRRRWSRGHRWAALPPAVVDTIAVTLFGISGVWLLGLGVDAVIVSSGHGAGQWLGAAPVAIVAAALFGRRLLRDLRANSPGDLFPAR